MSNFLIYNFCISYHEYSSNVFDYFNINLSPFNSLIPIYCFNNPIRSSKVNILPPVFQVIILCEFPSVLSQSWFTYRWPPWHSCYLQPLPWPCSFHRIITDLTGKPIFPAAFHVPSRSKKCKKKYITISVCLFYFVAGTVGHIKTLRYHELITNYWISHCEVFQTFAPKFFFA